MNTMSSVALSSYRSLIVAFRSRRRSTNTILLICSSFFFFNHTATTEIYTTYDTLSLHDALPILVRRWRSADAERDTEVPYGPETLTPEDRKSTRLNSSHRRLSRMPSSA